MDIAGVGGGAVSDGVGEVHRAFIARGGREGQRAIGVECDGADGVAHRVDQRNRVARADGLAVHLRDSQRLAIGVGVVLEHRDGDGRAHGGQGAVVDGDGAVIDASDRDGQRGGRRLAGGVGHRVSEDIRLALAGVQRLRSGIGHIAVRAVSVQRQRAEGASDGRAHLASGVAESHGRDGQAVAIDVRVAASRSSTALDHAIGGRDGQDGVFSGRAHIGLGHRGVVHAAHIQGHGGLVGRTRRVLDGVFERDGAFNTWSGVERDLAFRCDGDRAHRLLGHGVEQGHRRARGHGLAVDLRDGQRVLVWVGVIAQHVQRGGLAGFDRGLVVRGQRDVIDRRDVHMHLAFDRRLAVCGGVGEVGWALVVRRRCEGDFAVWRHDHIADGLASAVRDGHWGARRHRLAVDFGHRQGGASRCLVVGQHIDHDGLALFGLHRIVVGRWRFCQGVHIQREAIGRCIEGATGVLHREGERTIWRAIFVGVRHKLQPASSDVRCGNDLIISDGLTIQGQAAIGRQGVNAHGCQGVVVDILETEIFGLEDVRNILIGLTDRVRALGSIIDWRDIQRDGRGDCRAIRGRRHVREVDLPVEVGVGCEGQRAIRV